MKTGALQHSLAPLRFVDDRTFETKRGDLVQVLALPKPIGHECLSEDKKGQLTQASNSAIRVIQHGFRHYQYVFKRSGVSVVGKDSYTDPQVAELVGLRKNHLEADPRRLGSIEIFHVILLQVPKIKQRFSLSTEAVGSDLKAEQARHIEQLNACVTEFASQMQGVSPMTVLSQDGIFRFLRMLVNSPEQVNAPVPEDQLDFYMADESPTVYYNCLRLHDTYVRVLSLKQAPRQSVWDKEQDRWRPSTAPAILADVLATPGDFTVCLEFAPQAISKSRQKIGVLRSNMYSKITSGLSDALSPNKAYSDKLHDEPAKKNVNLLGEADAQVDSGNYLGDFSFTLAAYGRTDQEAKLLIDHVGRVLGSKANYIREDLNLFEQWLALVPGNYSLTRNLRLFNLPVDCYADLGMLWAANTGQLRDEHLRDEYLTVLETPDGQPHYFSPRVGEVLMMLLLGESGSGKSALTCHFTASFQKYSRKIDGVWRRPKTLIYDFGKSFEELTHYFGGQYKQIAVSDEGSKQNPFSFPANEGSITFLTNWFRFLLTREDGYVLEPDEYATLRDSVRAVFGLKQRNQKLGRLGEMRLPNDTRGRLESRLEKWRGGLFDTAENTFSSADWQTYEFRGFVKHTDALASYLYLINEGWDSHLYDPELISLPKLWVMDEAHVFMLSQSLDMGQRMLDKVTTGRKNNLSCIFTMPWGLVLEETKFGSMLKSACPTKVFTRSPGTEVDYQRIFKLTARAAEVVATLRAPGEALIHTDERDVKVKVDYDPFSMLLYSNDANTSAAKREAFAQYGREKGLRVLAKGA